MAEYCPKCHAGIEPDDKVCGNCGSVLEKTVVAEEDFTAGVFDHENLSHDVTGKQMAEESVDDETSAAEIVSDEIIADGMVTEEALVTKSVPDSPGPAQVQASAQKPIVQENTEAPMSLGDWMLTLLLLYIPIVNIVMLIIWSVDDKTTATKKHFAWATLIFMGIGLVLSIILSSIVIAIVAAAMESMYNYY